MATLSVCMITMNESEGIRPMLESIKDIADEIVAVDESTDSTKTILLKYGIRIIEGKLNNNYSALRNIAISSSTKEWIFFIDADETLEPGLHDALKSRQIMAFCDSNNYDAVAFKRKNYIDGLMLNKIISPPAGNVQIYPDWQFRLFRNNGKIKWTLPVHESLSGYTSGYFSQENYHILHMKSGSRQEMQNKKYATLYINAKIPVPDVNEFLK